MFPIIIIKIHSCQYSVDSYSFNFQK